MKEKVTWPTLPLKKVSVPESDRKSLSWASFFVMGFLFAPLNWLTSFFLAEKAFVFVLLAQLVFIGSYVYFLWAQWFNRSTDEKKKIAFIIGYLIPHAVALTLYGLKGDFQFALVGIATMLAVAGLYSQSKKESPRRLV